MPIRNYSGFEAWRDPLDLPTWFANRPLGAVGRRPLRIVGSVVHLSESIAERGSQFEVVGKLFIDLARGNIQRFQQTNSHTSAAAGVGLAEYLLGEKCIYPFRALLLQLGFGEGIFGAIFCNSAAAKAPVAVFASRDAEAAK